MKRFVTVAAGAAAIGVAWWLLSRTRRTGGSSARSHRAGNPSDPFDAACARVGAAKHLSTEQLLRFYSLFKQATVGPCSTPQPSLLDMTARTKCLDGGAARQQYIELAQELVPEGAGGSAAATAAPGAPAVARASGGGGVSGPAVSTMLAAPRGPDDDIVDLFSCASSDDADTARALIDQGADVNAANEGGETALHMAADRGSVAVAALLLAHGAHVNAVEPEDGQSPLMYAVMSEQLQVARMLIAAGGDLDLPNTEGESARGMADDAFLADLLA